MLQLQEETNVKLIVYLHFTIIFSLGEIPDSKRKVKFNVEDDVKNIARTKLSKKSKYVDLDTAPHMLTSSMKSKSKQDEQLIEPSGSIIY